MAIRPCIRQPEEYWGHVNPIGRRSCYDEGKRCAETLFFDYGRQYRLPIKVARIFSTYGPRMHPEDGRVVSNFIVQALKGEDITVYGDGLQTRSFCYVDDLIDGLVRLMRSATDITGPINLGNPHDFTIAELAQLIIQLSGSSSQIVHRPVPSDDPRQRRPDITRARQLIDCSRRSPCRKGFCAQSPISRNSWSATVAPSAPGGPVPRYSPRPRIEPRRRSQLSLSRRPGRRSCRERSPLLAAN
jgi:UDP-glucuronate decarboxylase